MQRNLQQLLDQMLYPGMEGVPLDIAAFNRFGKDPIWWFQSSRELYRAATILMEPRPRKYNEVTHLLQAPIALMLGAYAVEALLKMIIVAKHGKMKERTFESTDAKEFLSLTHDLIRLVDDANVKVNASDRRLLRDLSRYSVWAGKYPIPRSYPGYTCPASREALEEGKPPPEKHPTWPKFLDFYPRLLGVSVEFAAIGVVPLPRRSKRQ